MTGKERPHAPGTQSGWDYAKEIRCKLEPCARCDAGGPPLEDRSGFLGVCGADTGQKNECEPPTALQSLYRIQATSMEGGLQRDLTDRRHGLSDTNHLVH